MKHLLTLVIALALPMGAFATGKPSTPKPEPLPVPVSPPSAVADANAAADAAAVAQLRAQLAQAQRQLQMQSSEARAEGVGEVNVGGDETSYRSRALALSLAAIAAAPAVGGDCREHTRGGGNAAFSLTGGTKLLEDCLQRQHCLATADRLAAYGYPGAAARQLEKCGGVSIGGEEKSSAISERVEVSPAAPPEPAAPAQVCLTPEDVKAREKIILTRCVSK